MLHLSEGDPEASKGKLAQPKTSLEVTFTCPDNILNIHISRRHVSLLKAIISTKEALDLPSSAESPATTTTTTVSTSAFSLPASLSTTYPSETNGSAESELDDISSLDLDPTSSSPTVALPEQQEGWFGWMRESLLGSNSQNSQESNLGNYHL